MRGSLSERSVCHSVVVSVLFLFSVSCSDSRDISRPDFNEGPAANTIGDSASAAGDPGAETPDLDQVVGDSAPFSDPTSADAPGMLRLLLTDAPLEGIDAVNVTISRIEVHNAETGWLLFSDVEQSFDLLTLQDISVELGLSELPIGEYTQIRLIITDSSIVVDGTPEELKCPSCEQTGIKLIHPFSISAGAITTITLDFDATESVHRAGSRYILKPVIEVIATSDDYLAPAITIASPGNGEHLEDLSVSVVAELSDNGTGVDADSVTVFLDGVDITGSVMVTATMVTGEILAEPGTHVLRLEARDNAGNLGGRASTFSVALNAPAPDVASELEDLRQAHRITTPEGDVLDLVDWKIDAKNGVVHYLNGPDLAPTCGVSDNLTQASAEPLVRCFLDAHVRLFSVAGETPDPSSWIVASASGPDGFGFRYIDIEQWLDGLPIRNAKITLSLYQDKIVQFSGHLFVPSQLPKTIVGIDVPDADLALALARQQIGSEIRLAQRYVDLDRWAVVSEFFGTSHDVFVFDEARQEIFFSYNDLVEAQTPKTTTVGRYSAANEFLFTEWTQVVTAQVDQTGLDGDTCLASLAASGFGGPRVIHAQSQDIEDAAVYGEEAACDDPFFMYFDGATYNDPAYDGPLSELGSLMHVYFWMSDIQEFTNTAGSGYGAWVYEDPLSVAVAAPSIIPCAEAAGCYIHHLFGRPVIWLPRQSYGSGALDVMAHEYAHFIQDMYGKESDPRNRRTWSLNEGFADHNVARYAMHRARHPRSYDSISQPSYFIIETDSEGLSTSQHDADVIRGEAVPTPVIPTYGDSTEVWRTEQLFYRTNSSMCFAQDAPTPIPPGFQPYRCGAVLSFVYWELAWNACRLDYGRCAENESIINSLPWGNRPEELANAAFTYGLRSIAITENADWADPIGRFFDSVDFAYRLAYFLGDIQFSDFDRVRSVLMHHCVGVDNHCDDYHRLPNNPLPVAFTKKASFEGGDEEQLMLAAATGQTADEPTLDAMGSVDQLSHETSDGAGFARLDGLDDSLSTEFHVPHDGFFGVSAAVRWAPGTCGTALALYLDDVPYNWPVSIPCDGQFRWVSSDAGRAMQRLGLFGLAPHTVTIAFSGDVVDVDAVLVEPRECPPAPSCDGLCGIIDDGCGGTIDCGSCCTPTTDCEWLCGEVPDGCGGVLNCGRCSWTDRAGDGASGGADLVSGSATDALDPTAFDLRARFLDAPMGGSTLTWCFDTDLSSATGNICVGLPGADARVTVSYPAVVSSPLDVGLVIQSANGSSISAAACEYDTFNETTNTLSLIIPKEFLSPGLIRSRYVVRISKGAITDSAPNLPAFASGSFFETKQVQIPPLSGTQCD